MPTTNPVYVAFIRQIIYIELQGHALVDPVTYHGIEQVIAGGHPGRGGDVAVITLSREHRPAANLQTERQLNERNMMHAGTFSRVLNKEIERQLRMRKYIH